ncbi:collagen binding domain-containing protein [Metasolibacillus meyeri]|uniref:Collagen binding domain-containing protein n=1 Tax=Metasolibacillus meyeri TaxID=1071052 RepID=A0AAW9NHJ9_9BACL|nr:collagen binding domain-containing protein [Metasolibacillus meyeri]MEC1176910.1 collagen binding domain-containing protein [Metasolibacillus meyeri]
MRKKINIAMLTMLLVFQTVIGPLSVFADEVIIPEQTPPVTEESNDTGAGEGASTTGDTATVEPEEDEEKPQAAPLNFGPFNVCDTIPSTLADFKLEINNVGVDASYDQVLDQGQTGRATFEFSVDTQTCNDVGAQFQFELPNSILELTNNTFGQEVTQGGIRFSYEYDANTRLVTVTLLEVIDPIEGISSAAKVEFFFESYFDFHGADDELTHDVEIPQSSSTSITVPITFLPNFSGNPVTKSATSNVLIDSITGERTIQWEAWINEDGKDLDDAKLVDTMTGGHELDGDITVTAYQMGLNGRTTTVVPGVSDIYSDFDSIVLNGRYAYKLEYTTKVNLDIEDQVGTKAFSNQIALNAKNGIEIAKSGNPSRSTTYGEPLAKSKGSANNYESNWVIDYNFNRATIPQAQAWVEDRLPTNNGVRHLIDKASITVYEVNVSETGAFVSLGNLVHEGIDYTLVNPSTGQVEEGFRINFNSGINKAYRIVYKADYEKDFYTEGNRTLTNTVVSGTSTSKTETHNLSQQILTKTHTVDFDKQVITWTISVTADNEAISDLTLSDVFNYDGADGEHTLVEWDTTSGVVETSSTNAIIISNQMTDASVLLTPDNKTGFTITDGNIAKGQTATIQYKTKYTTLGSSVNPNGYGNQVTAEWETDEEYELTRGTKYVPNTADPAIKNGNKTGSYNYDTQRFDWKVVVNTNKANINGAVLIDTIGEGHELVGGIRVYEYILENANDDDDGEFGAELTSGYTINPSNPEGLTDTEFTITFDGAYTAPYKTYVILYQTQDIDNIIGIDGASGTNPTYDNTATFIIQGDVPKVLGEPEIPVKDGNHLLTKNIHQSDTISRPYIEWTLDINKSLSNLGETKVKDIPVGNIIVIKDSVKLRPYTVNAGTGITNEVTPSYNNSAWQDVNAVTGANIEYLSDGGFELTFDDLNKQGYQVIYRTLVIGQAGDTVSNNATIEFAGADNLADNQGTGDDKSRILAYSLSDANFSTTKGDLSFTKVAVDPLTGVKTPLEGVEFALVKTVASTDYRIATAVSDANGYFEFKNVNYATYFVEEIDTPNGYRSASRFSIVLNADNDTSLSVNESLKYNYEVKNIELVDLSSACPNFTITIKDVNGQPTPNKEIKLLDKNGTEVYSGITDSTGKIVVKYLGAPGPHSVVEAGEYTVVDENDAPIDTNNPTITVKYGDDCEVEVQATNGCPSVTITINDDNNNPRPNVTVTLKDSNNDTVATETTGTDGKFTLPSTTPAGTYKVYEGNQYLGTVTIDYTTSCEAELTVARACETFTLTINDVDGKPRENLDIEIVDKDDSNTRFTGTTNADGELVFDNLPPTGLPPAEYVVYEVGVTDPLDEFTVDTNCEHTVQPIPACPAFTLTIENEDGPLKVGTKVVIENKDTNVQFEATVVTDGKITFVTNQNGERYTIEPGNYTVISYEIKPGQSVPFGEDFTVTYTTNCEDEVKKPRLVCTQFEITVISPDGTTPKANTKVIIEDENGIETEYTTDEDGKITLPTTQQPGKVVVYEVNPDNSKGERIDEVTVTYTDDCTGIVIKNACPEFTLTINNKDNVPVGENVKVTIKDKAGAMVATGVTDVNGQIKFVDKAKLEQGKEYDVYNESGVLLGSITVSYIDEVCEAEVQVPENACPLFTLTIQDINGNARTNVAFVVKDNAGNTVVSGTTDADGKATIPYTVEPGNYVVVVGTEASLVITVQDCAALAKPTPAPPGGGGGGTPPEPGPSEPTTPPTEEPTTPPEETPEEPSVPEEPTTPPTPEEPVTPEKPTTPPGAEEVIKKIPEIPGIVPVLPTPGSENPVRYEVPNIPQIVEELKQNPEKLQQTIQDLETFIKQYEALSPEEQVYVDELVNMNLVRSLLHELREAANVLAAANNNQNKLPQTNDANQTTVIFVGIVLLALGFALLRRRFTTTEK